MATRRFPLDVTTEYFRVINEVASGNIDADGGGQADADLHRQPLTDKPPSWPAARVRPAAVLAEIADGLGRYAARGDRSATMRVAGLVLLGPALLIYACSPSTR